MAALRKQRLLSDIHKLLESTASRQKGTDLRGTRVKQCSLQALALADGDNCSDQDFRRCRLQPVASDPLPNKRASRHAEHPLSSGKGNGSLLDQTNLLTSATLMDECTSSRKRVPLVSPSGQSLTVSTNLTESVQSLRGPEVQPTSRSPITFFIGRSSHSSHMKSGRHSLPKRILFQMNVSSLGGQTRMCSTGAAVDASGVLVEHLDTHGSDHPTDADLDRVMGEPTSTSTMGTDPAKGPKVSIEATKLFNRVWTQVVEKMGGFENLNIPKEIVWLNGAPGSGKGANTPFILQTRGFPTKAISISSLLQDDQQAQEIMKSGALLSDSHVLELVLEGILKMGFMDSPDEEGDEIPQEDEIVAGVVVDGFPRTTMQVDFVKLLHDKLADLHYQYLNTPLEHHFPRPIFRIAVLYVEEEESVRRQLHRGRAALAHNQRAKESGLGELVEVRETDLDERAARRRYQIFREHYDTLLRLKSFFPFHLIDAMGTLAQCREQIAEELQYQSGLELGEDTFRAICHLPLAKNLVKQARQNMVTRLDGYMKHDIETFQKVIDIIEHDVIPVIRKCALAGVALYNTEQELFFAHPQAAEMLADVLSERGYYVTWQARTREIPVKVDLTTGAITCQKRVSLQFRVKFDRPVIRNPILYPNNEDKV